MSKLIINDKIKRVITALLILPPLIIAVIKLSNFWFF